LEQWRPRLDLHQHGRPVLQPAHERGNAKSLVKSAAYQFTSGLSTLDSNGDGIPDFVKVALGLNPNAAPNSDGSGYSDLEELIYGSAVTNHSRLNDEAQFHLLTTPRPWDGFSNTVSLCQTGMWVRGLGVAGRERLEAVVPMQGDEARGLEELSVPPLDADLA